MSYKEGCYDVYTTYQMTLHGNHFWNSGVLYLFKIYTSIDYRFALIIKSNMRRVFLWKVTANYENNNLHCKVHRMLGYEHLQNTLGCAEISLHTSKLLNLVYCQDCWHCAFILAIILFIACSFLFYNVFLKCYQIVDWSFSRNLLRANSFKNNEDPSLMFFRLHLRLQVRIEALRIVMGARCSWVMWCDVKTLKVPTNSAVSFVTAEIMFFLYLKRCNAVACNGGLVQNFYPSLFIFKNGKCRYFWWAEPYRCSEFFTWRWFDAGTISYKNAILHLGI